MENNNERSDGELLSYMGIDAQKWAHEWHRIAKQIYERDGITALIGTVDSPPDEGWMIGWFANALSAGELHAVEYEQHAPGTPREESAERTADAATAFLRSGQAPGRVQKDITVEMREAVEGWENDR